MFSETEIKRGMSVVDTMGAHIGTVLAVRDEDIALTGEGFSDDLHHIVSRTAILAITDDQIVVKPNQATSLEAVAGDILYLRRPGEAGQL